MYVATIVRDKRGHFHIRVGTAAQPEGEVSVIEILNGDDPDKLRELAARLIQDLKGRDA